MTTPWERELNRLERDARAARALLDAGEVPPQELWQPPADLGPMPEELSDRTALLVAYLNETSRLASERRTALNRELEELHRRRDAARAYNVSDPYEPDQR